MAKLVWQPPEQQAMAFTIRQERVAVGRDASNEIRLPELAVSARHAVIITRNGIATVHDLNSSNGTWVNGKRVESQVLEHGDVVQFGRLSMTYIDEAGAASKPLGRGGTERQATVALNNPSAARKLPSIVADSPVAKPEVAPAGPDFSELDRLMGSIHSFRDEEQKQLEQKREALLKEWQKVMDYSHALKTRLSSNPRLRFFEISERRKEVMIRIASASGQVAQPVLLSLGHMEQRQRSDDGIWVRLPGHADKRFDTCDDAMRDVVTTVAHLLA